MKKAKVQRKTLKDRHKAWRTIAQDHLKITRKSGWLEAKHKEKTEDFCTVEYNKEINESDTNIRTSKSNWKRKLIQRD